MVGAEIVDDAGSQTLPEALLAALGAQRRRYLPPHSQILVVRVGEERRQGLSVEFDALLLEPLADVDALGGTHVDDVRPRVGVLGEPTDLFDLHRLADVRRALGPRFEVVSALLL